MVVLVKQRGKRGLFDTWILCPQRERVNSGQTEQKEVVLSAAPLAKPSEKAAILGSSGAEKVISVCSFGASGAQKCSGEGWIGCAPPSKVKTKSKHFLISGLM